MSSGIWCPPASQVCRLPLGEARTDTDAQDYEARSGWEQGHLEARRQAPGPLGRRASRGRERGTFPASPSVLRSLGRHLRRSVRRGASPRARQGAGSAGEPFRIRPGAAQSEWRPEMSSSADSVRFGDPAIEEEHFLERLRSGDELAYEELVRTQTGRLLATARHFLPRSEDAQDAVQEAFVSAFRSVGSFRGGSSLATWLHRIVVNACLMKIRGASRRPEAPIEDYLPRFDETGHHAATIEDWAICPEKALLSRETRER